MIVYESGPFGFLIIFRLHGSAVLRALVPSTISTLFLGVLFPNGSFGDSDHRMIAHPYAIGAFVAAFSFIITFRANFAYQRYWEAAGFVHQMHSKWMDAAMALASFHYQSKWYDKVRPPSFGEHLELHDVGLVKERNRMNESSPNEMKQQLDELVKETGQSTKQEIGEYLHQKGFLSSRVMKNDSWTERASEGVSYIFSVPTRTTVPVESETNLDGGIDSEKPSLFLQEATHLISLLSAVALGSLRNDVEGAELPLVEYIPGSPWPPVDPDMLSREIRASYEDNNRCWSIIRFVFSVSRDLRTRTLYNAARPLRVLGGVSDAEALLIQNARGPLAKVALCTMWLQEFISREYMAGSTGGVAPPIISRLYQYISDGMVGYNQARKVAYVPFPFPHSQMLIVFTSVVVFFMPVLMYSFVYNKILAVVVNFFTVWCFTGLHEVARELENPFHNPPNDLPLANFQAQFNEALVEMFAGFHPDAFWAVTNKCNERKKAMGSRLDQANSANVLVQVDAASCSSDYGSLLSRDTLEIDASKNV